MKKFIYQAIKAQIKQDAEIIASDMIENWDDESSMELLVFGGLLRSYEKYIEKKVSERFEIISIQIRIDTRSLLWDVGFFFDKEKYNQEYGNNVVNDITIDGCIRKIEVFLSKNLVK